MFDQLAETLQALKAKTEQIDRDVDHSKDELTKLMGELSAAQALNGQLHQLEQAVRAKETELQRVEQTLNEKNSELGRIVSEVTNIRRRVGL